MPLILVATILIGMQDSAVPGISVPHGFEITEFAEHTLANDIYVMTTDPLGRIVVAGRGYIRILVDDDGDGKADRAISFADAPKDGAMGLLWEGDRLYFTGDGMLGYFEDINRDYKADGPPTKILKLKTGGEHAAHAIKRGPDGCLYVLCGNETGIKKSYITKKNTPYVKDPIAGCVLRISPDLKDVEVYADGFRNAYGMDFSRNGDLFTFDSDNERCVSLPWYEPTRFLYVAPGGNYGWRSPQLSETWRSPSYLPDIVPAYVELGRGSPTGVACYKGGRFPQKYQNGFLVCDWTFGTVRLIRHVELFNSDYFGHDDTRNLKSFVTPFMSAEGEYGFAPTSILVHEYSGEVYVSSGGRGTRGAVYKIRYVSDIMPKPVVMQPGQEWRSVGLSMARRRRKNATTMGQLLEAIERVPSADAARTLIENADWFGSVKMKQACVTLLRCYPPEVSEKWLRGSKSARDKFLACWRLIETNPNLVIDTAANHISKIPGTSNQIDLDLALDAIRLLQIAAGDVGDPKLKGTVWEGYSRRSANNTIAKEQQSALKSAIDRFPIGKPQIDFELTRLAAMVEIHDAKLVSNIVSKLSGSSDPVQDIHYLIVLARLGEPRTSETRTQALKSLVQVDRRLDQKGAKRDLHWPLRMKELFTGLTRNDPMIGKELVKTSYFGRPTHAIYATDPTVNKVEAAAAFLREMRYGSKDIEWTPQAVAFLKALPPEKAFPAARALFDEIGLRNTLLGVLAQEPQEQDRSHFVEGLTSLDSETRHTCSMALQKLSPNNDPEMLAVAFKAYLAAAQLKGKEALAEKDELHQLLVHWSVNSRTANSAAAWTKWLTEKHPKIAAKLRGMSAVDEEKWKLRLTKINWNDGDAPNGKQLFRKLSCAQCHSGSSAVGPDLAGVANRFSMEDLFHAILAPNAEVSARYRNTLVELESGDIRQGIAIYDAVDSLILQTNAEKTIRIPVGQIESRRRTANSIMPESLLDRATDRDLADLYAYLKSLSK